jgi:hypothetical protein
MWEQAKKLATTPDALKGIIEGSPALSGLAMAANVPIAYMRDLLSRLPASEQENILALAARHPNNPLVALQALWGASQGQRTAPLTESVKNALQAPGEAWDIASSGLGGFSLESPAPESTAPKIKERFTPDEMALKQAKMRFGADAVTGRGLVLPTGAAELPLAEMPAPPTDQTPGTISAYDRATGRYWQNYSRNNPTPTNTGTYDPIGGAQQSETAAMPFNMGGRYTKVNQGGSNMGELRNPDTASAYVKGNLERHKAEDLAPQIEAAAAAQKLKMAQATPEQQALMAGIAKRGVPTPRDPKESTAEAIAARLDALRRVRGDPDERAQAATNAELASLGPKATPDAAKEAFARNLERINREDREADIAATVGPSFNVSPPQF